MNPHPAPAEPSIAGAASLLREGRLADALAVVDKAAAGHEQTAEADLASACWQLGAVIARLLGDQAGGDRRDAAASRLRGGPVLAAGEAERAAAREAVRAARDALAGTGDASSQAQLAMLDVALLVQQGDLAAATDAAEQARQHALDAVAPMDYLASCIALAELANRLDDRIGAYEVMAVALVTLADLLGLDQARALAEPELRDLRRRWGVEEFATVKAAYEERRRAALGPNDERGT
jgi:hypothetical protein